MRSPRTSGVGTKMDQSERFCSIKRMVSPLQNSSCGENRMLVVWYGARKVDEDNDVAVAIRQQGCTDTVVVVAVSASYGDTAATDLSHETSSGKSEKLVTHER